jgi:hypothetical protein
MNPEKAEGLSPELQRALEPLFAGIESVSEQIAEYNERIERLSKSTKNMGIRRRESGKRRSHILDSCGCL